MNNPLEMNGYMKLIIRGMSIEVGVPETGPYMWYAILEDYDASDDATRAIGHGDAIPVAVDQLLEGLGLSKLTQQEWQEAI